MRRRRKYVCAYSARRKVRILPEAGETGTIKRIRVGKHPNGPHKAYRRRLQRADGERLARETFWWFTVLLLSTGVGLVVPPYPRKSLSRRRLAERMPSLLLPRGGAVPEGVKLRLGVLRAAIKQAAVSALPPLSCPESTQRCPTISVGSRGYHLARRTSTFRKLRVPPGSSRMPASSRGATALCDRRVRDLR